MTYLFRHNCDHSDIDFYVMYSPRDLVKIGFCHRRQDNCGGRIFIVVQGCVVWQRYDNQRSWDYTKQVGDIPVELGRAVPDNNDRYLWLKVDCSAWSRLKLNTKIGLHTTNHTGTFLKLIFSRENHNTSEKNVNCLSKLIVVETANVKDH